MSGDTFRKPRSRYDTTGRRGPGVSTERTSDTSRYGGRTRRGRRATLRYRVRRWWRHRRGPLARGVRRALQTVTPTGWFLCLAALGCFVLGGAFGWIEAWFVAIVAAVLMVLALVFLIGSRAYLIRIVVDRARVVAGGSVSLGIEVENGSSKPVLPAIAELPVGSSIREVRVPWLGPNAVTTMHELVQTPVRGVIDVGPITVSRRDPVGLLRRDVVWRDRHRVHVHPLTAFLPTGSAGLVRDLEGAARRRLTDSDLSFHAVREYAHGDEPRHIHWRSSAKTGTLMVRQYEESQTARSAIVFDANRAEYADDEEFELGVSVAASLSLQAVREGRERFVASQWMPGRIRGSIDGLEELPSGTPTQLLDAWSELEAAVEARPIESLARGLGESRRPLSVVMIVTGSRTDTARLRRAAVAFPPDVMVVVARCERLADPAAYLLDICTVLTVGAIGDLPGLMMRSGAA